MSEQPLRIFLNRNLLKKASLGKLAAHAAHAALAAYGIKYTHPIVVLMGSKTKVENLPITIHDAGHTELEPGTLTAGAEASKAVTPRELRPEELKSLWLHRAVLNKLMNDPERVRKQALSNITRWSTAHRPDSKALEYLLEWEKLLLSASDDALASVLTSRDEHAVELRVNSPFAGVLTDDERMTVLDFARNSRKEIDDAS